MSATAGAAGGDWLRGAACLAEGLRLVLRRDLRRHVTVPLAINVVLFTAGLVAGWQLIGIWLDTLLPAWLAWLLWPLLALLAAVVVFFLVALVANVVAAPFNDALAGAVARQLDALPTERPQPGPLAGAIRSVADELAKLGWFALRAAPLALLSVIPGLQPLAPFAWALFGAWALALEYMDYPLSMAGLRFGEQRRLAARRRSLFLGFGSAAALLTAVPLVNFLAMPAAVAGAVVLWARHLRPNP